MVSQEILDYVKKELERGVSEAKLRQVLIEYGWPESEINEAFEKSKAKPAEKIPKEPAPEQKPKEVKKEKPFKEFLEGLGKKKPEVKEEAKPEEVKEKPPVMEDVKKILTNKLFIIAAVIIVLGSVAFFVIPSIFEEEVEGFSSGAMAHAQKMCTQYCNSNLCGLIENPGFTQPELVGKSCEDLGFPCSKC